MNIILLCVITSLIIVTQGIQVGKCPLKCRHGQVCEDSDCPYDGCEKGWWGRQCEYPLECLIPGDNGEYYRGTRNTTAKGETCADWSNLLYAGGSAFIPTDGANHSYCRHITGNPRPNIWCYIGGTGGTNFDTCFIPMCSEQCPIPNLTSDYVVVNQPREGFAVGTKLKISCNTGYKTKIQYISCGDNKQWTSPARCQALECLLPGENGKHYRGTQNTTSDGTPCLPWNITHPPGEQFMIPIDGTKHNYCRHVPSFSMSGTWCYTTHQGTGRKSCSIVTCSEYCSPPDLQHTQLAVEIPNTGLHNGTVLDLDCKAGYWKNGSAAISCELDGQWSDFPSGICAECPEDRYGVACSGQCNCNNQYTVNCDREDGTCHCIQGRRGVDCSYDVNECEADARICGDNGNCTNTEGSYTCVCHQGYTKTSGYCQAVSKPPSVKCKSKLLRIRSTYILHDAVDTECDGFVDVLIDVRTEQCQAKTECHDMTKMTTAAFIGTTSGLVLILIVVTVALIFTCSRYRRRERNRPVFASTNEVELANIHQYESISQYEVIIHELRGEKVQCLVPN